MVVWPSFGVIKQIFFFLLNSINNIYASSVSADKIPREFQYKHEFYATNLIKFKKKKSLN